MLLGLFAVPKLFKSSSLGLGVLEVGLVGLILDLLVVVLGVVVVGGLYGGQS